MAKFTRGGGEANAVAIRIARSNTKKKYCFCGYHGWYDWYLSSNITKNLDDHLMSGLNYDGIPDNLKKFFLFLTMTLNILKN